MRSFPFLALSRSSPPSPLRMLCCASPMSRSSYSEPSRFSMLVRVSCSESPAQPWPSWRLTWTRLSEVK